MSSPKTVGDFTAVGYFFARQLRKELNVPIGLINSSWGGTHAETWTSRDGLSRNEELRTVADRVPVDGEAWKRQQMDSVNQRVVEKQRGLQPTQFSRWRQPETDTRSWPVMNLPSHWERRGLAGLKGIVWFRKEVELTSATDVTQATLQLGPVGELDSTFVNGRFVGSLRERSVPRRYTLPTKLLRPGRNVTAVWVRDSLNMGGFIGASPSLLRLAMPDTSVSCHWRVTGSSCQLPYFLPP